MPPWLILRGFSFRSLLRAINTGLLQKETGKMLTEQKRLFAQEYITDLNATQAAIRAGYSEDSAYSQGSRLLKDAEVRELIQQYKDERARKLNITQERVLQEYAKIGFSNIGDYLRS